MSNPVSSVEGTQHCPLDRVLAYRYQFHNSATSALKSRGEWVFVTVMTRSATKPSTSRQTPVSSYLRLIRCPLQNSWFSHSDGVPHVSTHARHSRTRECDGRASWTTSAGTTPARLTRTTKSKPSHLADYSWRAFRV